MKRICCFCEHWGSGGIESFLCNILTRMNHSQFEFDMVCTELDESIFTEPLKRNGVNFFELSGNYLRVKANCRMFRDLVRERHYDVLHLNVFHGLSLIYLKVAREEGILNRIAHSHNTALRISLTRPLKLVVHRCAKEFYTKDATELWACSKAAAIFLFSKRELSRRGFNFIPNGIDVNRFRFQPEVRKVVRRELGLENNYVIGNIGRLCYQKNQRFLIDVFAKVIKQKPESRLLLVGDGEEKDQLVQQAKMLGIREHVLFYGATNHVERLLWAMDVFAFPSRFEGLPIAVVEAQAAGLYMICSKAVTEEARVTSHICMMSLEDSTDAWADAILGYHKRLLTAASEIIDAGFDILTVTKQVEKYYLEGEYEYCYS